VFVLSKKSKSLDRPNVSILKCYQMSMTNLLLFFFMAGAKQSQKFVLSCSFLDQNDLRPCYVSQTVLSDPWIQCHFAFTFTRQR